MSQTAPEMQVVLTCADPEGAAVTLDGIDSSTLDWDHVLRLAASHGVLPLLARHRPSLEPAAPTGFIDELVARARSITARNLLYIDTLQEVVGVFRDDDIRALAFKGPVLDAAVFGDEPKRQYSDLDLLVAREDFDRAVARLGDLGFEPDPEMPPPQAVVRGGLVRPPMLEEYSMHRGDTELELRWRIGDKDRPFRPGFEALWSRRHVVDLDGTSVPVLDPVDRLQMLAFHGTKHRWHQLKWVADFAAAWSTHFDDPAEVVERASATGNRRRVMLGVALLEELFGRQAPPSIGLDPQVRRLARGAAGSLRSGPASRPSSRARLRFNLSAADSTRDRAMMLVMCRPLHPNLPEYRMLPLPNRLHAAYYVARPVRLLTERVRRAVG